jgi:hypothetical protein
MVLETKGVFVEVRFKDGKPFNDAVASGLLRRAANLSLPNQDPDEMGQVFGTPERKKVGQTWPANKQVLLNLVNKNRTDKLPLDAVAGTAKVVAVVKEGGVRYVDFELTITTTFKDFNETVFNGKPARLKINGENKSIYTYRFPADFSTGPVKSSWKNQIATRHEGTLDGQNSTLITEVRDGWSETARYSSEGGGGKAP